MYVRATRSTDFDGQIYKGSSCSLTWQINARTKRHSQQQQQRSRAAHTAAVVKFEIYTQRRAHTYTHTNLYIRAHCIRRAYVVCFCSLYIYICIYIVLLLFAIHFGCFALCGHLCVRTVVSQQRTHSRENHNNNNNGKNAHTCVFCVRCALVYTRHTFFCSLASAVCAVH